jgi:hypothetical protein
MRHRTQKGLSAFSGLLRRNFADSRNGVASHRRTASRPCPVDDDVGLCARRPNPNTKARHLSVPGRKFGSSWLQPVYNALSDTLFGHGSSILSVANRGKHRGSTRRESRGTLRQHDGLVNAHSKPFLGVRGKARNS